MKTLFVSLLCGLSFSLLLSFNTFATYCACCSEKGYYSISYSRPTDYQLDLLKAMKFGSIANLYMDAGSEDDIKGVSAIAEKYDLKGSFLIDTVDCLRSGNFRHTPQVFTLRAPKISGPRPDSLFRLHFPPSTGLID